MSTQFSKYDLLQFLRLRADIVVKTKADLFNLKLWQRRWSVLVGVYNDSTTENNGLYILEYNQSSELLSDNDNWRLLPLFELFSKNYQPAVTPPDVNSVRVGDSWTHPDQLKEYRLVDQGGERWWVETTNF